MSGWRKSGGGDRFWNDVTTWHADGVTMEHIPDAFNWHDGRLFVRVGAKEYKSVSHGANETNLDGLFGLLACAPAASIDSYLRSHGYEVSPVASHCGSDSYLAAVREADEKAVK